MFARSFTYNGQGQRRRRVVSVPLIRALLDQPRYSLHDPRIAPPATPRPAPKPKRETTGKQGRPRGAMFHVERERDPLAEALWAATNLDDPLPADFDELVRR
jgi:hypothetical protein